MRRVVDLLTHAFVELKVAKLSTTIQSRLSILTPIWRYFHICNTFIRYVGLITVLHYVTIRISNIDGLKLDAMCTYLCASYYRARVHETRSQTCIFLSHDDHVVTLPQTWTFLFHDDHVLHTSTNVNFSFPWWSCTHFHNVNFSFPWCTLSWLTVQTGTPLNDRETITTLQKLLFRFFILRMFFLELNSRFDLFDVFIRMRN